jgi:hypothetical protein
MVKSVDRRGCVRITAMDTRDADGACYESQIRSNGDGFHTVDRYSHSLFGAKRTAIWGRCRGCARGGTPC